MNGGIPTSPTPITSLGQLVASGAVRPVYTYTVPESLGDVGARSVGLVELNAGEELMAAKRAMNNPIQLAYELAKEALRAIDGRPLSLGDGSTDVAWGAMCPKLRNLVMAAYNDLHSPEAAEVKGFLKSRQAHV